MRTRINTKTVGTRFNKTKSEYHNRFLGVKMCIRACFCGQYEIIQRAGSDVCARAGTAFSSTLTVKLRATPTILFTYS